MPGIDIPITIETTNVRVDRETTPSVTLAIRVCILVCDNDIDHIPCQAQDGGTPTRNCVGRIIIEILDENDNCPMFNNLVTTYNIREDLSGDEEVSYNNNMKCV